MYRLIADEAALKPDLFPLRQGLRIVAVWVGVGASSPQTNTMEAQGGRIVMGGKGPFTGKASLPPASCVARSAQQLTSWKEGLPA